MTYDKLPSKSSVEKSMSSLKSNGIDAYFAHNAEEAKKKVIEIIPKGASVMTMTSVTLDSIGVTDEINNSGKYDSVRNKLMKITDKQNLEVQKLISSPGWVIGSVHAVTEDGKIMIASNTGSQLPAYAYGAGHVIWVVGTQKLVKNVDDGMKRIYEHSLPLESERAKKAYGVPGSSVNKILIVNKEVTPGRITLIFVNEVLGF